MPSAFVRNGVPLAGAFFMAPSFLVLAVFTQALVKPFSAKKAVFIDRILYSGYMVCVNPTPLNRTKFCLTEIVLGYCHKLDILIHTINSQSHSIHYSFSVWRDIEPFFVHSQQHHCHLNSVLLLLSSFVIFSCVFQSYVTLFYEYVSGTQVIFHGPDNVADYEQDEAVLYISNHQCTMDWVCTTFLTL